MLWESPLAIIAKQAQQRVGSPPDKVRDVQHSVYNLSELTATWGCSPTTEQVSITQLETVLKSIPHVCFSA